MARRGVVMLLGCAWTLVAAGLAPAWAAERPADQPVLLAQARVPVLAQAQPPRQQPRLISLDFKDADINNILRILAEFSGLNIVSSDDVKGKVTVKLQNVPWQQALDSVVRAAKLGYVQEGNIIRVDKLENLTKEAEAQFKAETREVEIQQRRKDAESRVAEADRQKKLADQKAEFDLAPLVEEIVPLKYAHVGVRRVQVLNFLTDVVTTEERKGVEEAITGGIKKEPGKEAGLLSSRGSLTIDQRTNSVIVRDIPPNVQKIKDFVQRLDKAIPAVQIEARIVEINKDDARRLGVVWGGAFTPRAGANAPIIDVRGGAGPRQARGNDDVPAVPPSTASNFPAGALPTPFTAGNLFGLGLGWLASNFALDLSLQALEGDGKARVISSPSLMTLENEPATIASGEKIPIISLVVVAGAQQASVSYSDVTTRLQVVPRVAAEDGRIVLTIAVKRDTLLGFVVAAGLNAPRIGTKQTITQVRIPDGGTVVISGLRDERATNQTEGLPWVKNIPVLGWLFKNELTDAKRSELMIFLTAKVVESPGEAAAAAPQELPGAPGAPAT
ncbi:MAG: secretin and TonB N-terminal domain-containing protein, partial [Candidatus Rokubacteria bacterium]|nr:secretin and TonB N-terminal domain-containing protein [Candidatus Rokubacteria bacterium]